MTTSPKKLLLLALGALVLTNLATLSYVDARYEKKLSGDVAPTTAGDSRPVAGISCNDGHAWYTSENGTGFATSQAVTINKQFVDCSMTYTLQGKAISVKDLYVEMTKN